MSYFWFSFSKNGKNQGVINTEGDTFEAAKKKVIKLGIVPEYDDVERYEIKKPEIPVDRLISPEEMKQREYTSIKYRK